MTESRSRGTSQVSRLFFHAITHAFLPMFTARDYGWASLWICWKWSRSFRLSSPRLPYSIGISFLPPLFIFPTWFGPVPGKRHRCIGEKSCQPCSETTVARLHKYELGMSMILECGAIACWRFGLGEAVSAVPLVSAGTSTPRKKSAHPHPSARAPQS